MTNLLKTHKEALEQLANEYPEFNYDMTNTPAELNLAYVIEELMDECTGRDFDKAVEYFRENYYGLFSDMEELAKRFVEEFHLHEIPEHLQSYFDYEKYAEEIAPDYFRIRFHPWMKYAYFFNS